MVIPSFLFFVFSYLAAGTTGYLRYGDAISLAQVADKGVLYSLGVANDASGKAVIGGWKSDTISRLSQSPNTMLYIQPAQEATRWGSSNVTVKYGDLVRLEFASLAATTPSWLGYDFSSSADTAPAQIIRQTTNFSQNPNLGITFKIVRAKNFDATNDGTANSIVATGDQIALWGLVTPGGATPAKQMVLNFQTSTTTPDTGTFFCSAYPSTAAVNNYIFSIPSQHIQAQVLNFANANTLPANVLAPAQNVNDWQKTTPTTKELVPPQPPPPPLCYGDAIILQHKTYRFYLQPTNPITWAANGNSWIVYGVTQKPTNNNLGYFFVEPLAPNNRFGAVGTSVKSGDNIRLESVFGQSFRAANEAFGLFFNIDDPGDHALAPKGCPPYYVTIIHGGGYAFTTATTTACQWPAVGYKIYKLGAHVGDPICQGDSIYIVSWSTRHNSAKNSVWLGSENTVYKDGFESFIYEHNSSQTPPPNFQTNFIWTISEIQSANSQIVKSVNFSAYVEINAFPSSASLYQF